MAGVSDRLRGRIDRDYPDPGSADEVARLVSGASESERIQAAIVLLAGGDVDRLHGAIRLTGEDWRDTLCGAGLEHEDWPGRLDAELGPAR
jgi:hypothetical protein